MLQWMVYLKMNSRNIKYYLNGLSHDIVVYVLLKRLRQYIIYEYMKTVDTFGQARFGVSHLQKNTTTFPKTKIKRLTFALYGIHRSIAIKHIIKLPFVVWPFLQRSFQQIINNLLVCYVGPVQQRSSQPISGLLLVRRLPTAQGRHGK